jgi:hypothetical protein
MENTVKLAGEKAKRISPRLRLGAAGSGVLPSFFFPLYLYL